MFQTFVKQEQEWLDDYALFMSIKDSHEGKEWTKWEEGIKLREQDAIEQYRKELIDDIIEKINEQKEE